MVNSGMRKARGAAGSSGTTRRPSLIPVADKINRRGGEQTEGEDLLHHRLRLGIVSALAGTGAMTFVDLRALLKTTDGNLSVHARKLEEADYISCSKSFAERRPRTEYRLEPPGRRALERYLDHMQAVIEQTRNSMAR